jgi:hypothetical protein
MFKLTCLIPLRQIYIVHYKKKNYANVIKDFLLWSFFRAGLRKLEGLFTSI